MVLKLTRLLSLINVCSVESSVVAWKSVFNYGEFRHDSGAALIHLLCTRTFSYVVVLYLV
jgi:hypothetical protein